MSSRIIKVRSGSILQLCHTGIFSCKCVSISTYLSLRYLLFLSSVQEKKLNYSHIVLGLILILEKASERETFSFCKFLFLLYLLKDMCISI